MTSGGTDVIEMSASACRSTSGATVDVVVGDGRLAEVVVEKAVVTTVVGASVEATDDDVEAGPPDDVGAPAGAAAPEAHEAGRSAKATTHLVT